ncbi:cytosolic sulfotransferase 5-like [Oryza brachyantha]|uniref:cytosolic sulfotransferase 5-like n=1 Tax=Oryza brachyantha TaxID=4533 RepID=UPI001ADA704D|nr:cytosolic sulfotransferase 5-like [Oryza brachyantha]
MAAATGPVPYKEVGDEGTAARDPLPRDEFAGLVASLPRKEQFLDGRLYQGFWLPEHYLPGVVAFQRRFTPRRPDDVVLVSFPKCGTTWLKALAFAVMARAAYPAAAGDHPLLRLNPHDCIPFVEDVFTDGHEAMLDRLPSPRLINTHVPYPLLPEAVTGDGGCKVVYICRDPKDMVVSLHQFLRRLQPDLSFADMFDSVAVDGTAPYGPMWDHVLGYWRASLARPDRVLFLTYEDLLQDAGEHVRAMARFMGRPFSPAEEAAGAVEAAVELCSFEKMKGLEVNRRGTSGSYKSMPRDAFFRKGVAGDWVNHMSPEMAARLDEVFRDKLRGTGLTIPRGPRHG